MAIRIIFYWPAIYIFMGNDSKSILNIIIPSKTFDNSLFSCVDSVFRAIKYYYQHQQASGGIEISVILREGDIVRAQKYYQQEKNINFFSQGRVLKGESYARNVGISNNRSRFIVFVDHDCVVKEDWVIQILLSFKKVSQIDKKTVCVMGNHWLYQNYSFWLKLYGKYRQDHATEHFIAINGLTFTTRLDGRNFAILPAVIKDFHFREDVVAEQDREFGVQLINHGYRILFNESMVVYHEPLSLGQIIKRQYIYGKGSSKWRKTPNWFYRFYFFHLKRFLVRDITISQMLFTMLCNILYQVGRLTGNFKKYEK